MQLWYGKTNGMVCNKVMNIMTALPPPNGETTAEVGDEYANECIHDKIVCDGKMSSIVSGEHDLMLLNRG